jgi:hypothetical protein
LLDIDLKEEIGESLKLLVDEGMKEFLQHHFIPAKSNLLYKPEKGDFQRILLFYGIDLKLFFPEITAFTTGQKAHFNKKGIFPLKIK